MKPYELRTAKPTTRIDLVSSHSFCFTIHWIWWDNCSNMSVFSPSKALHTIILSIDIERLRYFHADKRRKRTLDAKALCSTKRKRVDGPKRSENDSRFIYVSTDVCGSHRLVYKSICCPISTETRSKRVSLTCEARKLTCTPLVVIQSCGIMLWITQKLTFLDSILLVYKACRLHVLLDWEPSLRASRIALWIIHNRSEKENYGLSIFEGRDHVEW